MAGSAPVFPDEFDYFLSVAEQLCQNPHLGSYVRGLIVKCPPNFSLKDDRYTTAISLALSKVMQVIGALNFSSFTAYHTDHPIHASYRTLKTLNRSMGSSLLLCPNLRTYEFSGMDPPEARHVVDDMRSAIDTSEMRYRHLETVRMARLLGYADLAEILPFLELPSVRRLGIFRVFDINGNKKDSRLAMPRTRTGEPVQSAIDLLWIGYSAMNPLDLGPFLHCMPSLGSSHYGHRQSLWKHETFWHITTFLQQIKRGVPMLENLSLLWDYNGTDGDVGIPNPQDPIKDFHAFPQLRELQVYVLWILPSPVTVLPGGDVVAPEGRWRRSDQRDKPPECLECQQLRASIRRSQGFRLIHRLPVSLERLGLQFPNKPSSANLDPKIAQELLDRSPKNVSSSLPKLKCVQFQDGPQKPYRTIPQGSPCS